MSFEVQPLPIFGRSLSVVVFQPSDIVVIQELRHQHIEQTNPHLEYTA
jgi:hypothetical protein